MRLLKDPRREYAPGTFKPAHVADQFRTGEPGRPFPVFGMYPLPTVWDKYGAPPQPFEKKDLPRDTVFTNQEIEAWLGPQAEQYRKALSSGLDFLEVYAGSARASQAVFARLEESHFIWVWITVKIFLEPATEPWGVFFSPNSAQDIFGFLFLVRHFARGCALPNFESMIFNHDSVKASFLLDIHSILLHLNALPIDGFMPKTLSLHRLGKNPQPCKNFPIQRGFEPDWTSAPQVFLGHSGNFI